MRPNNHMGSLAYDKLDGLLWDAAQMLKAARIDAKNEQYDSEERRLFKLASYLEFALKTLRNATDTH